MSKKNTLSVTYLKYKSTFLRQIRKLIYGKKKNLLLTAYFYDER